MLTKFCLALFGLLCVALSLTGPAEATTTDWIYGYTGNAFAVVSQTGTVNYFPAPLGFALVLSAPIAPNSFLQAVSISVNPVTGQTSGSVAPSVVAYDAPTGFTGIGLSLATDAFGQISS